MPAIIEVPSCGSTIEDFEIVIVDSDLENQLVYDLVQIDPAAKSIKVGTDDATLDGQSIILKIAVMHKSGAPSEKLIVSIKFALGLQEALELPFDANDDKDDEVRDSNPGFNSILDLEKELKEGGLPQI